MRALNDGLRGISATGTQSFSFMTTQTKNDFSAVLNPLRTGVSFLLFFGGAIWLYNRSKNITV
jgi:hypothetical protein